MILTTHVFDPCRRSWTVLLTNGLWRKPVSAGIDNRPSKLPGCGWGIFQTSHASLSVLEYLAIELPQPNSTLRPAEIQL